MSDAFELLREQTIAEVNSVARLYRHRKTGAEVLSLINDDENKVFGVTFKTPPSDSTGVAHILEHSVLCGSRKYPVKKPFVELLKGSLQTFLNAMTFPDKTAYPVASQNLQDFYNLVDVYLDAVYFPLISEDTFRQEGWHYEADGKGKPLVYKGVVFNEMKGAYSSPEAVLRRTAQMSLYPDTTYGVDSGGEPKNIPDLTYKAFKGFHERFYHPSNTRAFFYGDDDPEQRLVILDAYFSEFEPREAEPKIGLQPRFNEPRQLTKTYAGGREDGSPRTSLVSMQWMLDEIQDPTLLLGLNVLEYILVGTAAAPLRKALTDSGLGEGFAGGGLSDSYRQPMFSIGLKGIVDGEEPMVETLVVETLRDLAARGLDRDTIDAALNTVEFHLRENNTGSFPRGISLMFRSMTSWLHDGDPLEPLSFEGPLAAVKDALAADPRYFEGLIERHINENAHRTTVMLKADGAQADREAGEERAKLDDVAAGLDEAGFEAVVDTTENLKALQNAVDDPADLAKIPTLTLADLPRTNKPIPTELGALSGVPTLFHDLATSGVIYLDVGFDLKALDAELLPYVPLFSRALFQTGVGDQDFVALSQRMGRLTGGVGSSRFITATADGSETAAWFLIRGKATLEHGQDLLDIIGDVLRDARLDNRERLKQVILEDKARFEGGIVGSGNAFVTMRLRSRLHQSDWASEQMGGLSQLFLLRQVAKDVEDDWPKVQAKLEAIRSQLINRAVAVANVTTDATRWASFAPLLEKFLSTLPSATPRLGWAAVLDAPKSEGLIIPAKVNFVGKGADLRALGFELGGASSAVLRHLNTTWLWDKVRVQGGAYGGSSSLDPFAASFAFSSYRDPNLLGTIDAYDGAGAFLQNELSEAELTRSIIGAIGSLDAYQLPDAKGFTALARYLSGNSDERRQQRREELLGAGMADFRKLGDALNAVAREGKVVVLGSEAAIDAANKERGGFLAVSRVL